MWVKGGILALFLLSFCCPAHGAVRDFSVAWSHDCLTIEGDDLDENDDGVCEGLTGFRFYTEAGEYIHGIAEDGTREHVLRINAPWGDQCFQMTAVMDDPVYTGQVLESSKSNIGACKLVHPGRPDSPNVEN